MSFKDAFGKAKGKGKPAFPSDDEGQEPEKGFPGKKAGKKGGFAEAAKNAKKKCKK